MSDLHLLRVKIPQSWPAVIEAHGLSLSEFTREAMRREFKRLGIKAEKLPEIQRGAPKKTKPEE